MNERERAVLATAVVTAIKEAQPRRLDPLIEQLELTPWDLDVVAVLQAVRYELERQRHAKKPKR